MCYDYSPNITHLTSNRLQKLMVGRKKLALQKQKSCCGTPDYWMMQPEDTFVDNNLIDNNLIDSCFIDNLLWHTFFDKNYMDNSFNILIDTLSLTQLWLKALS